MDFRAILLFAPLLAVSGASADVSFNFDYSGSVEFNHPTLGQARRDAFEDAASRLERVFDHSAVLDIRVSSSNDPSSGTLAWASSSYTDLPFSFFGYDSGVVMHKVLTGSDKNGSASDGEVHVNFGVDWDFDDEVSPLSYDFKATIIHEIVHVFGFVSGVFQDGTDVYDTPPGNPGVWEVFDDHLSDKNGVPLINDATFALDGSAWFVLRQGGASPAGGLFFNGPNAVAANGGQPVGLYSPTRWESGSSGSHLDDENPAQAGLMMLATTDTGRYRRNLGDIERGILMDLGFQLHPLPEPRAVVQSIDPGVSVELAITGPEDRWYAVECSDDLDRWEDAEVVELRGGAATVPLAIGPSDKRKFFRLRETGVPASPVPFLATQGRARR